MNRRGFLKSVIGLLAAAGLPIKSLAAKPVAKLPPMAFLYHRQPNYRWGLPDTLYGIPLIIEDAVDKKSFEAAQKAASDYRLRGGEATISPCHCHGPSELLTASNRMGLMTKTWHFDPKSNNFDDVLACATKDDPVPFTRAIAIGPRCNPCHATAKTIKDDPKFAGSVW